MIPAEHVLIFSILLFAIGLCGLCSRPHALRMLISIEIMISAAFINIVYFSGIHQNLEGPVFFLFLIALSAVSAVTGLSIFISAHQTRKSLNTEDSNLKW